MYFDLQNLPAALGKNQSKKSLRIMIRLIVKYNIGETKSNETGRESVVGPFLRVAIENLPLEIERRTSSKIGFGF
jgi:hypothetical protein